MIFTFFSDFEIIYINFNSDVQLVFAVTKGCHNVSIAASNDFAGQVNLYCLPSNPEVPVGVSFFN